MDYMSDEKTEEKDTPSETSPEEKPSETVTEDEKKTDDKEQPIPKKRFDEVNNANKVLKLKLEAIEAQVNPKVEDKVETKSDVEERLTAVEFMAKHKEFDSTAYEAAYAIAKGRGVSLDKAIEDPLFIALQEKNKSEAAVNEATPAGGRSPKVQPDKPQSDMSRDEHREHFEKVVKALGW